MGGHEGSKGGRIDYRARGGGGDRVHEGGARAGWVNGWSLKCPPPMTAYLILDIQTCPCPDQQVCGVAVTIMSGQHERSGANLHPEWA